MSAEALRVGDLAHDTVKGAEGIVTDKSRDNSRIRLRPVHGCGEWVAQDPQQLTLVCRREERADIWAG